MRQIENIETRYTGTFPDPHFISEMYRRKKIWSILSDSENIRIFENSYFSSKLIKSFSTNSDIRTTSCSAAYGNNNIIRYHKPMVLMANKEENLNTLHKLSAFMDESLWNDCFDYLVIMASTDILENICNALSRPVRARILITRDNEIDLLDNDTLKKKLSETVRHLFENGRRSPKRKQL